MNNQNNNQGDSGSRVLARLGAQISALTIDKAMLQTQNEGLQQQVAELQAKLDAAEPDEKEANDDGAKSTITALND